MENVSTLKHLVASTGFSFNLLENRPLDIELTEGKELDLKHIHLGEGSKGSLMQQSAPVHLCMFMWFCLSVESKTQNIIDKSL